MEMINFAKLLKIQEIFCKCHDRVNRKSEIKVLSHEFIFLTEHVYIFLLWLFRTLNCNLLQIYYDHSSSSREWLLWTKSFRWTVTWWRELVCLLTTIPATEKVFSHSADVGLIARIIWASLLSFGNDLQFDRQNCVTSFEAQEDAIVIYLWNSMSRSLTCVEEISGVMYLLRSFMRLFAREV